MPELDAERRERLAEELRVQHFDGEGCGTYGNNACSVCHGPSPMSAVEIADALAPLIAGWLAEAWDAGYGAGDGDQMDAYWGQDHPPTRNPYRAGEGA